MAMARTKRIREGDIFLVNLEEAISQIRDVYPEYQEFFDNTDNREELRFFQYLMLDPAQLNSEVIRVFSFEGSKGDEIELAEIASSGIVFHAHVVIKWGIEMGLWKYIGNIQIEPTFTRPFFRMCGDMPPPGPSPFLGKSYNWYVWQAGQRPEDWKHIGELTKEYELIDKGSVFSPIGIVYRMATGEYLGQDFY